MPSKRGCLALLGVPIDNLTMDEAVALTEEYIAAGGFHQIATANVDFLMKAIQDDELMSVLQQCSAVVSDGMPLVWASRMLRTPLKARVNGTNLLIRLAEVSGQKQRTMFLLGAKESQSNGAAEWLRKTHPGLRVERYAPPVAPLEAMDHEEILKRIEACAPDILVVAFGNPKQEKWLAMHRDRLAVPVCLGVGGSLDFLSGEYSRAPVWMQNNGLEWLHRITQEPGRLGKRYSSNAAGLVRYLLRQVVVMSAQPKGRAGVRVSQERSEDTSVFRIAGRFSGEAVTTFDELLHTVETTGCSIVVDLSATEYLGADALGSLLSLSERMRKDDRELWVSGVRPAARRVLRASFLEGRLRFASQVTDALRSIDMVGSGELLQHGSL